MKKNELYIYITAYLAMLIPTTGRFVYGVTLMIELFLLSIIGTLVISLIKKIKMENMQSVILLIALISFTILYRQFFAIIYSEIALVLGLIFYLPPISVFMINNITKNTERPLLERLKKNTLRTLVFSIFGLFFFLIRDIAGFGTFTFYGSNHHIYEKVLFNSEGLGIFAFIASIPGALIFAGILIFLHVLFGGKMKILSNAESQQ